MSQSSWMSSLRGLLWLAAPLTAAQAGNHLMLLVDSAILGRLSEVAQGAAGLANNLFFAFSVVGMGVLMSLDPLISQAIGAKQPGLARTLLWQGLWLALLVGAVLALPLMLLPLALPLFRLDPETAEATRLFLWLRLPALWPLLCYGVLRNYLQAEGLTWPMIVATIVGNLTNAAAAYLLVFGGEATLRSLFTQPPTSLAWMANIPALGLVGAATATTLCTVLQVLVLVMAARRVPTPEPFSRRPSKHELRRALRVGLPIGLQLMAEVGAFSLVGLIAGSFGKVPLAAHQIALTWASFTFAMALGMSTAGAVLVGKAVGAQDHAQTRRAGLLAFAVGGALMSLSALAFWLWPAQIAAVLSNNPAVIQATIPLFAVAAVFQVFDGLQAVGAGVLRGAGDTNATFRINVFGHYVVGLPIGLALGVWAGLGVRGLWWGLCAGLVTVGLLLFKRFWQLSSQPIARL